MLKEKMKPKRTQMDQCRICGDKATFAYFGATSCHACKMFFKRNAENQQKIPKCNFDGRCEIHLLTRQVCTACRLQKCFDCGMQVEKIRAPLVHRTYAKRNGTSQHMKVTHVLLPTANLLRADVSTLTTVQWTLLNNLIGSCTISGMLMTIDRLLLHQAQSNLPTLSTADQSLVQELLADLYQEAGRFCRVNRDFQDLYSPDRSTLLATALSNAVCLCGLFTFSQKNMWHNQKLLNYFTEMYGPPLMRVHCWALKFVQFDEVLFKLALPLYSLSTLSRVFQPNLTDEYVDVKTILVIESRYAELVWKYLLYRYTFKEAVRRFSSIIRWFLTMSLLMYHVHSAQKYVHELELLIEDTELTLIIDEAPEIV